MRICITSNSGWTLYNFRLELMKSLRNDGHEVIAISNKDAYTDKIIELGFEYYVVPIHGKSANPFTDIRLILAYKKSLALAKADLVLNFTIKPVIYASIAAKFLRIPAINNITGLGHLFTNNSWLTDVAVFLFKISQRQAFHIFFQNNEDIELFKKLGIVQHQSYSRIIGSGVDIRRFKPIASNRNNGKTSFIFFGRILRDKGIEYCFEAVKLLQNKGLDFEFKVLGLLDFENPTAISANEMNAWCKEGYFTYLGTSDEVEKIAGLADCMVYPSFYREGVPRALLEATAMGLPIITTNNIGCKDVVEEGLNGFLIPIKNTKALAAAMESFLNLNRQQQIQMGAHSRKLAEEKFSETFVIDAYKGCIQKISEISA